MALRRVISTSPTFGKYAKSPLDLLRKNDCDLHIVDRNNLDTLRKELAVAEGWICGLETVPGELIALAPHLKVIAKNGVGVNNIDLAVAAARGIVVTFVPALNKEAVADLTIGLMIAVARQMITADRAVRQGQWPRVIGTEVFEHCLGIVGFGNVGKAVAKRARGFDMRILAYDAIQDTATAAALGVEFVDLDTLLRQADFVSLHVPLLPETRGLIGERELSLMRQDAYLINAARGDVVDEAALARFLREGRIAGAGIDTFVDEPPLGSPFLEMDNVVLSPHMGGYTLQALDRVGLVCADNVIKVLNGVVPPNVVSLPK